MFRASAASFRVGGGLKDKQVKMSQLGGPGMFLRKIVILTPLLCREMRLKLTNEILKYKLSGLKDVRAKMFCPIDFFQTLAMVS